MPRTYPALDVIWPLRPDDERVDVLLAEVDEEGPTAVEQRTDRLRIFFPSPTARGRAAVRLVALEPDLMCEPVEVPDEDWAERSQASLGAVQVGDIVVAPPWVAESSGPVLITILPSMGFGTAHHASTRLCLRLLQELSVTGASVLDVGTGSGVLAIAAARLGASRVLAIDNDPDALTSARENIALNGVQNIVTPEHADFGKSQAAGLTPQAPFDVVLANLTGAALTRHAHRLAGLVAGDGTLIASGIEIAEQDEVLAAFAGAGLRPSSTAHEDDWTAVRMTPTSPRSSTTR